MVRFHGFCDGKIMVKQNEIFYGFCVEMSIVFRKTFGARYLISNDY